jgi:hypothetical protein
MTINLDYTSFHFDYKFLIYKFIQNKNDVYGLYNSSINKCGLGGDGIISKS